MIRGVIIQNPTRVTKDWGEEVIIRNGRSPDYCGKVLRFKPKTESSLHYHVNKCESWFVANGSFNLTRIDPETGCSETEIISAGDVVIIPTGQMHKLQTDVGGEIFEVSSFHEDTDTYRVKL